VASAATTPGGGLATGGQAFHKFFIGSRQRSLDEKVGLRGPTGNRETLDLTLFCPQASAQKRELFRDAT